MKKILAILSCLILFIISAGAQSSVPFGKSGDRLIGSPAGAGSGAVMSKGVLGAGISKEPSLPSNYGKYKDEGLQDLKEQMDEREWGSEDTAWKKACEADNIPTYEKYLARFPYGQHAGNAQGRIIDIRVNDALNSDHNALPQMQRTMSDDDSPTSTIVVENTTRYPLTVMYSGVDTRSVTIPPHGKSTVTVRNGSYRIAASVPVASVIPFAGGEEFSGGRYETGFCIVRR